MPEISKEQFVKGVFWKIMERFAARGISLVISVVLARLLLPEDYGLVALATVFTNLSDILIDAGFGTALIRKDKVDDDDYNCVFAISATISVILYIILFLIAPMVSAYYAQPELTSVLRVMSLVLFIQAFSSTRNAYVNRKMQFKLLMKCNTVASIVSGIMGIVLAYLGVGVWALVAQRILQQLLVTVILFVKVRWKPRIRYDKTKFKYFFGFSAGVIGASLINYIENCLNSLIVGKHYSVEDLGYYDKGNVLPEQISLNFFGAMTNVLLPTISSYQNDLEKMKQIIRKVMKYTSFLLFPAMFGLFIVSEDIVYVLFGEKWLSAVPMMKWICIYYIATPLMLIDVQVFFALGYSGTRVKTEIIRLIFIVISIISCCFIFNFEIEFLSMFIAISVCVATLASHIEVQKMIGYKIKDRIRDTWKSVLGTFIMCVFLFFIKNLTNIADVSHIGSLLMNVVVGAAVYIVVSILIKNEVFLSLKNTIIKYGKKHE